jgi:hypothetical protein
MHPEFRQAMMRRHERELSAAVRDIHAHEETTTKDEEPLALRLIWAGSERSHWPSAFAAWRIAG